MEQEINRWYKKLWETKGARFIAAKRYETHERWSILTISIVSVYIIALNLTAFLDNRPEFLDDKNITFYTICLSILVIVVSVILHSRDYKILAHKFHTCGREITEIYDKVNLLKINVKTAKIQELEDMIDQYNTLLMRYDINHTRLDYLMFIRDNVSEYDKIKHPQLFKVRISIWYFLNTPLRYWFFILIPIVFYFILLYPLS